MLYMYLGLIAQEGDEWEGLKGANDVKTALQEG